MKKRIRVFKPKVDLATQGNVKECVMAMNCLFEEENTRRECSVGAIGLTLINHFGLDTTSQIVANQVRIVAEAIGSDEFDEDVVEWAIEQTPLPMYNPHYPYEQLYPKECIVWNCDPINLELLAMFCMKVVESEKNS